MQGTVAQRIHGLRAPMDDRVRSDKRPTMGSDAASHTLAKKMTAPASTADKPASLTRNFRRKNRMVVLQNAKDSAPTP